MKTEIVTSDIQFKDLRDSWNDLLLRSGSKCVFLSWEWLYYWWLHFKKDKELNIVLVKNEGNGELLGIAPICINKIWLFKFLPVRKYMFLGTEKVASDFLDFIICPGSEESVIEAIYEYLDKTMHKWDVFDIQDIDNNSSTIRLIEEKLNINYKILERRSQVCPYLKLPESHELLLKALSSNMRSNLKRRLKDLEERQNAKFSVCTQNEQIKGNLDTLFYLHNRRFAEKHMATKSESSFSGEDIEKFHHDVAGEFFSNDMLRFYLLEVENKIAAILYAFKYKDTLFYYQSGNDPKWHHLGLGNLLFIYCMDDGIKQGLREFNFLRGREDYKFRWTKEYKETINILLCNHTLAGMFFYLCAKSKEIIKRILKKNTHDKRNNPCL